MRKQFVVASVTKEKEDQSGKTWYETRADSLGNEGVGHGDVRGTVVQVWKALECQRQYWWGRSGWVMVKQTGRGWWVEDRTEVTETCLLLEGFLTHAKEILKIPRWRGHDLARMLLRRFCWLWCGQEHKKEAGRVQTNQLSLDLPGSVEMLSVCCRMLSHVMVLDAGRKITRNDSKVSVLSC